MKKGVRLKLSLITAMTIGWTVSCSQSPQEVERCVDGNGVVVDDSQCECEEGLQQQAMATNTTFVPMYHWYYGGTGFIPGERAVGGSFTPTHGFVPVRANGAPSSSAHGVAVSRGGFGATAAGHAAVS